MRSAVCRALDTAAHGRIARARVPERDLRGDGRGLLVIRRERVPRRPAIGRLLRLTRCANLQPPRGCNEDDRQGLDRTGRCARPGRSGVGRAEGVIAVRRCSAHCANEYGASEVSECGGPLRGWVRQRAAAPGLAAVRCAVDLRLRIRIPRADVATLRVDERDAVLALRRVDTCGVRLRPGRGAVDCPPERDGLTAALRCRRTRA